VFWPYRPRQGCPSVPDWLFLLILVAGFLVSIAIYGTINAVTFDDYGPG
jgi:hypothetical protein